MALYTSMPLPPDALIAVIATPTLSDAGAVYVGAVGVVRSTVRVRVTSLGEVYPVLLALTVTVTLDSVM